MNPAYSVILFTVSSGAGYGLLALLGLVGAQHGPASSLVFALAALIKGLALVTIGLLSSTFHLGHPERAWRAFSQWRSSWLSREGVLAVLTYPVVLAFGAAWSGIVDAPQWIAPLGLLTTVMCLATVFCTGQIYASLKPIPRWHHGLTTPVYLVFAVATGAAVLAAVATVFGRFQVFQAMLAAAFLLLAMLLKWLYWRSIDGAPATFTMSQATGLGAGVRQWEVPHTATNFIQKEMGYVVARRHARRLRGMVLAALVLAVVACLLAVLISPWFSLAMAVFAVFSAVFERWLFFAEAQHASSLYYGAAAV
jgi:sulfite dehydrogenase (quinone) subunit SoeC